MSSSSGPLVTGISPKEGPPGTNVTIRGERLGKSQSDLVRLEICGVDCLLTADWKSPNKILARTLLCRGKGDINIFTRSGGKGSSTVQFRGFMENIGPTKESSVWVDETVSVGPRPLSMSSYQQEDPLQISVEGNERKKIHVEELLELFPEGSGNLRSENFVPAWFLLENHHSTGFEDLKSGLHFLGRKVGAQTEGKLSFLKEHMSSVIDQLDALIVLKEKFDLYGKKHGGSFIAEDGRKIDEQIAVCERDAGKLFQDVLARKDRADVTRNALSAYQRFRFLFSLPGTMQRSIEKGEYEIAINDYARAKTLFLQPETNKPVFLKFREEVETRAEKLRETLNSELLKEPPNSEEQRILIGYLVTLEAKYDPAWVAIMGHFDHLKKSMKKCFEQFSPMEKGKDVLRTPSKQDSQPNYPSQVLFVEAISDIFSTYFPEFWHLGQDYFAEKLPIKPNLGKQADMKRMMMEGVELYATLIASALLPSRGRESSEYIWNEKSGDSLSEWLPHCLSDIRESFSELLALDPPREMVDIIRSLLFRIRVHSLEIMVQQMGTEVSDLYKHETWTSEPLGKHGFITALPNKYENLVINCGKMIKETILQKYIEEKQLLKSEEVRATLKEVFGSALASFADALELLMSKNKRGRMNQKGSFSLDIQNENDRGGLTTSQSTCLLLILNNCSYTKDIILPQIYKALIKLGFPEMPEAIEKARIAINGVENLTFAKYTEMKYEPVVGQIEQGMYAGRFDWNICLEPFGVRPYITKAILGMIEIVSEVSCVSEKLVFVVMTQVVESVCEELTRLFSCVPKFSEHGSGQAALDVASFQDAVNVFLTPNSKTLLKETFGLIPKYGELVRSRKIQEMLDDHRKKTKLQYLCFTATKSPT